MSSPIGLPLEMNSGPNSNLSSSCSGSDSDRDSFNHLDNVHHNESFNVNTTPSSEDGLPMTLLDIVTDMNTNEMQRSQVDFVLGEPPVPLLDILNEVLGILHDDTETNLLSDVSYQ